MQGSTPARPIGLRFVARLPVRRRDINVALNLALPCLLVLSFVTGWIASLLGLTEFGVHKYTSIAAFVVACGHLVLHWRALAAQVGRLRHKPPHLLPGRALHLVGYESEPRAAADVTGEPPVPIAA